MTVNVLQSIKLMNNKQINKNLYLIKVVKSGALGLTIYTQFIQPVV